MNAIILRSDFSEWAGEAGYETFHAPGNVTIANDGGEIRFTITIKDVAYVLERAERAERSRVLMISSEMTAIERMLVRYVGNDLRSTRNYARIFFPYEWNECAPGYSVIDFGERWTGLSHFGHPMQYRIRDRDLLHPAVMFSYIADADPAALMQSYESPDGAPAARRPRRWRLRVRAPRRRDRATAHRTVVELPVGLDSRAQG